jgi:hypothetical protein
MSLTPSQIKIKARLYDLLQTLHFTKARDDARADDRRANRPGGINRERS